MDVSTTYKEFKPFNGVKENSLCADYNSYTVVLPSIQFYLHSTGYSDLLEYNSPLDNKPDIIYVARPLDDAPDPAGSTIAARAVFTPSRPDLLGRVGKICPFIFNASVAS